MASSDGPVRATADDAVVSKLSAAAAGYFDDPFVSRLAGLGSEPPPKRMPIINVSLGFFLLKKNMNLRICICAAKYVCECRGWRVDVRLARHVGPRGGHGPRRGRVLGGAVSGGGAERHCFSRGAAAANRLPRRGPGQPLLPPLAAVPRLQLRAVIEHPAAVWSGHRGGRRGRRGAVGRASTTSRERQGPRALSRNQTTPINYSYLK